MVYANQQTKTDSFNALHQEKMKIWSIIVEVPSWKKHSLWNTKLSIDKSGKSTSEYSH
jgi:hypothetical protein